MASALQWHGCTVSAICPAGHPLTFVSGIRRIYRYRGMSSLSSLQEAIHDCQPELIIPCDDGVVGQLHALHASDPGLRAILEHSLGPHASYAVTESRYQFLSMAAELGLRVPKTRRVHSAKDIEAWHAENGPQAVIKVDGESGGNGVRISQSLDQSLGAWRELCVPSNAATAWKRFAIDGDPLALWNQRRARAREMTVQEYIPGRPANSMLVCWRGKLLSIVSVAVVAADGPTGASMVVRLIHNEQMTKAAKAIVEKLNLSGFHGLDFVLEASTGTPYLIEMNPRCTQLGHIELPGQGSLAGVMTSQLRSEAPPKARDPVRRRKIALFPQALSAGSVCRAHIDASFHDVPDDQPRLREELLLKSRPQRRLLARLYHWLRPVNRATPVVFETFDPAASGEYRALLAPSAELIAAIR